MTQLEVGSTGALLDRWIQALGARPRVMFEPFAYEAIRAANRQTFGRDAIPYYALEDAEVILSFGADWAETWLEGVGAVRGFTRMHGFRDGRAGTVIHVEPRQSLTASNADQWIRNAPGTEGQLALAMLKVMVEEGLTDPRFGEVVESVKVNAVSKESGVPVAAIKHAAEAFARARPGLAIGGGMATHGLERHGHPGRREPPEPGGGERGHAPCASARTRPTARPPRTPRSSLSSRPWAGVRSSCCSSARESTPPSPCRAG